MQHAPSVIGWESDASFFNQSENEVKQNQTNVKYFRNSTEDRSIRLTMSDHDVSLAM